ncbi:MAG TPA: cytochrome P450 [Caulobacteraceae bacterium]|nr:cytochrome P450 [Caulobacteraceae bacterium]
MKLEDINLLDRDVFARRIPHDWFSYLRANAPVYRHPERRGPGFWVVSRYEDVRRVTLDVATFSSDGARGGVVALEDVEDVGRRPPKEMGFQQGARLMNTTDPPEHARYRKLVNKGFTPRMVGQLEDRIRAYSGEILDLAIAKGECDWVVDVAAELPIRMISELLGVPYEDRGKIFEWSNRIVGSEDPEFMYDEELIAGATREMFQYAQMLADTRRREPRDDIISTLIAPDADGDRLADHDFNLFFLLLAIAGNETTRYTATHGMAAMLDHPDQYAELVADPGLIPAAVEEMLRWASPVMYFRRTATRDTEIRGVPIKAGDKVAMYYISANSDEEVFKDPYRFDIHRSPNLHLAFGGGGPHFCLGAGLARLQLRVLFEELVRRAPKLQPAGSASRLRSLLINGIKHLPADLSAGARGAPAPQSGRSGVSSDT